ALARGERTVRTNMLPTDEVGRMGRALDQYADYVQERQDTLRASLRCQRRENERLMAVLEALPDGIIVQDLDGRVLVMNEPARDLLGSRRMLRSNPDLQELTAFVTDRLGPALAPGIYMLGEPQNIRLDERIINAQVAAVTTVTRQRIGTVIILRDVTEQVQVETAREYLLQQIEAEVQEPLRDLVHASRRPTSEVAREIRQHAGALQKMILEMRELSDTSLRKITEERQRPILLDTLVWAVANEWRQVAQAQNLNLHVLIEKPGLYVLAEERRLRWAIGNIIDNAIKYTPPGGDLTLEVRDDTTDERAHLRVRDNGVGIARDELPHVFNRFYRGRPKTKGGREIRVPGSGQGLTVAKQIFEAHGGSLTIKSKQWVGTAVYFTIPLTSPVSYELPPLAENLEGETVRIDTRQINAANEQSQK
ncbi:MAG TPA: ATP-binding protein, partial [Spirillospora sp.]|nr:ATP-binding protein [Spirillospora sp.]